jgi:ribonuclease D
MGSNDNKFDATASMLGYLYQARYALYLSLRKIREVTDPDEFFVSIEKLDDIAFESGGNAVELLQTKYHGTVGNLTDRSPDLWKTIRVWADAIANNTVNLAAISFTLITTQAPPASGLIASLTPGQERNVETIKSALNDIAKETGNATNAAAYSAYDSLADWQKDQMIRAINILCRSENIIDLADLIKKELRTTVEKKFEDAFLTRLEGVAFPQPHGHFR